MQVIVNDDSRSEGANWINALKGDAFVAYCHDIHEIRGYNRLTRFASTDYVAELQVRFPLSAATHGTRCGLVSVEPHKPLASP